MSYQCPECKKNLKTKKSLKRHIETQHQSKEEPKDKKNIKVLEIKAPKKKKPTTEETESGGYHCNNCGATLTKGQDPCPACGEALNWEGIE